MTRKSVVDRLRYLDGLGEPNQDDPFHSLGVALQAVIEHAVTNALASMSHQVQAGPVMLSVPEAAEQLGVGTTKLKQLVAGGELASVTIGRRRLVPASSLRAFAATADENNG
jgi:excisionase family DNA binding protein